VLLSPAFATASHPDARPLGAIGLAAIVRAARRRERGTSVVALGGIAPSNVARLGGTGVAGIAAIGALARG
jgi:thiamine-phosphate pyrophosphorylase